MHCKYCGVSIDDDSKICPLCHELAVDDGKETNTNFPPKTEKARKPGSRVNFHNLYISIAILVAGVCVAINLTLTPDVYWFTIVMAVLAYGYLTVANAVMSNSSIWIKIFWQILMITLILWAAQSVLNPLFDESANWLLDIALPVILGISVVALGITAASLISDRLFAHHIVCGERDRIGDPGGDMRGAVRLVHRLFHRVCEGRALGGDRAPLPLLKIRRVARQTI